MKNQILKRILCVSLVLGMIGTDVLAETVYAASVKEGQPEEEQPEEQQQKDQSKISEREMGVQGTSSDRAGAKQVTDEKPLSEESAQHQKQKSLDEEVDEMYGRVENGVTYMPCTIGGKRPEDRCLAIVGYTGTSQEVIIPSSIQGWQVYMLGKGVFDNKSDIKKIVLPDSIEIVEEGCFDHSSGLEEIELGEVTGIIRGNKGKKVVKYDNCYKIIKSKR